MGAPDNIFHLTEVFKKDPEPKKYNLGVGAYRSSTGKPYRLPSVTKAEQIVIGKNLDKEYLPITGNAEFVDLSAKFLFGVNSCVIKNHLNCSVQTLSGTGALCIGGGFLKKFLRGPKVIYVPDPTWGNHITIFEHQDLAIKTYRYYDPKTKWLNFDGLREDLCVSN